MQNFRPQEVKMTNKVLREKSHCVCQSNKSRFLKQKHMLNTMKILIKKILNIKLVTILEFQNIKTFLLKDTLQTGQKFLLLVRLKIQFLGLMLLVT